MKHKTHESQEDDKSTHNKITHKQQNTIRQIQ